MGVAVSAAVQRVLPSEFSCCLHLPKAPTIVNCVDKQGKHFTLGQSDFWGDCLTVMQLTYDDGNTESTPIGSGCSSQVKWTSTGSGKIVGALWKDGALIDAVGFYFINVSGMLYPLWVRLVAQWLCLWCGALFIPIC